MREMEIGKSYLIHVSSPITKEYHGTIMECVGVKPIQSEYYTGKAFVLMAKDGCIQVTPGDSLKQGYVTEAV